MGHGGSRIPHGQGWGHAGASSRVLLAQSGSARRNVHAVASSHCRTQAPAHTVAGAHEKAGEAAAVAAVRTERTGATAPADSAAISEGNVTEESVGGPWHLRGTAAAVTAEPALEARADWDMALEGKDRRPSSKTGQKSGSGQTRNLSMDSGDGS